MQYYRNYLLAVAILAPILGLVAKLTARMVGVDVRYIAAAASTFVGYCLAILAGLVSGFVLVHPLSVEVRLLAGLCAMTLAHAVFLRSRDKERLGLPKAIVVALAQLVTGLVILFAVNSALAR